jgi:predicted DNA-binding transcriptional regulator YafY
MGKKWDDRRSGEKLLHLFSLLLHRKGRWSLKEISKELNCSKPTVLRLLDQLKGLLYATVHHEKVGRESTYWLEVSKETTHLTLSEDGLKQPSGFRDSALLLLTEFIQKSKAPAAEGEGGAPEGKPGPPKPLTEGEPGGQQVAPPPGQTPFQAMAEAIRSKTVVTVAYRPATQGEPRILDFAPMALTVVQEGPRFLGWILGEGDKAMGEGPCSLPLSQLESVTDCERAIPRLPNPLCFEGSHPGPADGRPYEVSLRFDPEASHEVAERLRGPDQRTRLLEDGSLELTLSSGSKPGIVQLALGFAEKAEALSPDWLREEIRRMALAILVKYGG